MILEVRCMAMPPCNDGNFSSHQLFQGTIGFITKVITILRNQNSNPLHKI